MKYSYIAQPPGIMSPALSRIAFCMYMVKFVGTSKVKRNMIFCIIASQLFVNVGTMIEVLISCENFAMLWDRTIQGRCWSLKIQAYVGFFQGGMEFQPSECQLTLSTAWNSMTDLVLTILPVFVIKNLNMELRTRVVLCILLGLSCFAMVACIVKTIELKALGDHYDFTYSTSSFVIWFTVEQYIVIIAASIPTIRPLMLRLSQRWKNRSTPSGSQPTMTQTMMANNNAATATARRASQPELEMSTEKTEPISSTFSWSSAVSPRPVRLNTPTIATHDTPSPDATIRVELEPPYIHPSPRSPPPPGTIRKTISIVIRPESMDENLHQTRGVQTTISAGPTTPQPLPAVPSSDSWPWPREFEEDRDEGQREGEK